MLVKITNTSAAETLVAIDAKTNTEFTADLLGMDGAVKITEDGAEMDIYTYNWWAPVIKKINEVEVLKQEYRERFNIDEVLFKATKGIYDLDLIAPAEEKALKEAFGEI